MLFMNLASHKGHQQLPAEVMIWCLGSSSPTRRRPCSILVSDQRGGCRRWPLYGGIIPKWYNVNINAILLVFGGFFKWWIPKSQKRFQC
jgi:hypothetical protein